MKKIELTVDSFLVTLLMFFHQEKFDDEWQRHRFLRHICYMDSCSLIREYIWLFISRVMFLGTISFLAGYILAFTYIVTVLMIYESSLIATIAAIGGPGDSLLIFAGVVWMVHGIVALLATLFTCLHFIEKFQDNFHPIYTIKSAISSIIPNDVASLYDSFKNKYCIKFTSKDIDQNDYTK